MPIDQEKTILPTQAGWANYAALMNDKYGSGTNVFLPVRQSQRMFVEHFSRRLLQAHGIVNFICTPHSTVDVLCQEVLTAIQCQIGSNVPGALSHGCVHCAHQKRYYSDFTHEEIQQLRHFGPTQVAGTMDESRREAEVCSLS